MLNQTDIEKYLGKMVIERMEMMKRIEQLELKLKDNSNEKEPTIPAGTGLNGD